MATNTQEYVIRITADQQSAVRGFADLKKRLEESKKALKDAQGEATRLARDFNAATNPSRALTNELGKTIGAAGALKRQVAEQSAALEQSRRSLTGAGVDVRNLASEYTRLGREAQHAAQVQQNAARLATSRNVREAATAAGALPAGGSVRTLDADARKAAGSMETLRGGIGGVTSGLAALGVTVAGVDLGRRFVGTVSAVQDLESQLRFVSRSAADYAAREQFLVDLSERHHKNLLVLSDGYAKLSSLEQSGAITSEQTKQIMEGLSDAQSATGVSTDKLNDIMYGFSQAASQATLQAAELNQVTEPMPGLLDRIAKAAGVTRSEFRELVLQQKVSGADFVKFFIQATQEFQGAAAARSSNISAGVADLENAVTRLAKTFDSAGGGRAINEFLGMLSTQVDQAAEDISLLGKAWDAVAGTIGGAREAIFGRSGDDMRAETEARTAGIKLENTLRKKLADEQARLSDLTKRRELAAIGEVKQAAEQSTEEQVKGLEKLIAARRKDIDAQVQAANTARQAAKDARAQADEIAADTKAKADAIRAKANPSGFSPELQDIFQRGDLTRQLREGRAQLDAAKSVADPKEVELAASKIQKMAGSVQDLAGNLREAGDQIFFIEQAGKLAEDAQRQIAAAQEAKAQKAIEDAGKINETVLALEAKIDELQTKARTVPIEVQIDKAKEAIAELQAQLDALPNKVIRVDLQVDANGVAVPADGAQPPGFARGTVLPGYGGGDRRLALLEDGEAIIRKESVRAFGRANILALNAGILPRFADGGIVGPVSPALRAASAVQAVPTRAPGATTAVHLHIPGAGQFTLSGAPDVALELQKAVSKLAIKRGRA